MNTRAFQANISQINVLDGSPVSVPIHAANNGYANAAPSAIGRMLRKAVAPIDRFNVRRIQL